MNNNEDKEKVSEVYSKIKNKTFCFRKRWN